MTLFTIKKAFHEMKTWALRSFLRLLSSKSHITIKEE